MLDEKLNRMMFNGRTLEGKFRRGFWKKAELDALQDAEKPSMDADAGLYYNGGWQFWIIKTKSGIVCRKATNITDAALDALKICYPDATEGEPLDAVRRSAGGCIKHDANYFMDL